MASTGRILIHILVCVAPLIPVVELVQNYDLDDNCGRIISLGYSTHSLTVDSQASYYYSNNVDCSLVIKANYGKQLSFYFQSFDINGCFDGNNYVEIRDGAYSFSSTLVSNACISKPSRVQTTGREARIRFRTNSYSIRGTGFKILVTEFNYGPCDSDEVKCDDGKCINRDLCSDGYDNCGDYDFTDYSCSTTNSPTYVDSFWWVWLLIGLGVFIVVVSVIVAVACCVCKNKRPGTVIQSGPMVGTTTYNTGTHAVSIQQGNPWYGNIGQTNLGYQPPAFTATSGTGAYTAPSGALTPGAPPSYTTVQGPVIAPVPAPVAAPVPPTDTQATERKL